MALLGGWNLELETWNLELLHRPPRGLHPAPPWAIMKTPMSDTLSAIIQIGIAISAEKNLDRLLALILDKSMDFSCSDGGSIYLVRKEGLAIKLAFNRSLQLNQAFTEQVMPITAATCWPNNHRAGRLTISNHLSGLSRTRIS